jgi:hypothetical protein
MKKLFLGLVAAVCVLALSAPVFADIKVGGMVASDVYWLQRSEERMINLGSPAGQDDWSTTRFAMPQAWNRLWLDYKSDDKKIAGYIQLRAGGIKGNTTPGAGAEAGLNGFGENTFTWEYAWIDWHINPALYFRMGRQTQAFAIYTPDQNLGHADGHIVGAGFGNIHGGTSRDAFRAYIKFSDAVRMEVQLLDPNTEVTAGDEISPVGEVGAVARESNTIPRIDIALPIKIGNFAIEPSGTWLRQEWDQVGLGDDDYDIWGVALGLKAGFGPFTVSGEVTYGENLGGGNYVGSLAAPALVGTTVEDAEELAAWIQLAFDFGPFAIQGIVGRDKVERDGLLGDDIDIAQWMYGVNFPVKVAKNFTITPNVWFYDYDDDATVGGVDGIDRGEEITVGVQFLLTF